MSNMSTLMLCFPSYKRNQNVREFFNDQSIQTTEVLRDSVFNMSHVNYSIHSIIAAYGLGLAPHGYYLVKMMANAKGQSSNILYVF